jgi:hypothetical protein
LLNSNPIPAGTVIVKPARSIVTKPAVIIRQVPAMALPELVGEKVRL